jgi:hypothetical protein
LDRGRSVKNKGGIVVGLRAEEMRFINQAIETIKREIVTLPDEAMGIQRPQINNLEDAFVLLIDCTDMIIKKNEIDSIFEKIDKVLEGLKDAEKNEEE